MMNCCCLIQLEERINDSNTSDLLTDKKSFILPYTSDTAVSK